MRRRGRNRRPALRPSRGWLQRGLIGAIKAYRLLLSPWLGSACRFEPTCSAYALQALDAYGAATGSYLALRRLVRCHPGCPGGCDPVPSSVSRPSLNDRSRRITGAPNKKTFP